MTILLICAAVVVVVAAGGVVMLVAAGMATRDELTETGGIIGGFGLALIAVALLLAYAAGGA